MELEIIEKSNIIELDVVEKYNPYHDEKGRFTTAGGATSFTIGSKSGLAWDKKNVQRAIEREKKRTAGGSRVDECKSVGDVESLIREKDWFVHHHVFGKDSRSDKFLKLEGCDVESAKEVYRAFEQFYDKYPQMVGKLSAPSTGSMKATNYAECTMGFGHESISLNARHFGNSAKFKESLARDVEIGWHPKGCDTIKSVVIHELGHSLDGYLAVKQNAMGATGKNGKFVSNKLRPKVAKASGVKVGDMGKEVSRYATKDVQEWFAESFAEFMCSPSPRKVAVELGKQLDEIMKGVE